MKAVPAHLAIFCNSCKLEGLIATQKRSFATCEFLANFEFRKILLGKLPKLFKNRSKNEECLAPITSLCSKNFLCKFCEFLKDILRIFGRTRLDPQAIPETAWWTRSRKRDTGVKILRAAQGVEKEDHLDKTQSPRPVASESLPFQLGPPNCVPFILEVARTWFWKQTKKSSRPKKGPNSVARLAKFSPKCEKWRNFKSPGEILKALANFPILAKFGKTLVILHFYAAN